MMAANELEQGHAHQFTAENIRHLRDPESYPSRAERWEKLLEQHPKKGKPRGRK